MKALLTTLAIVTFCLSGSAQFKTYLNDDDEVYAISYAKETNRTANSLQQLILYPLEKSYALDLYIKFSPFVDTKKKAKELGGSELKMKFIGYDGKVKKVYTGSVENTSTNEEQGIYFTLPLGTKVLQYYKDHKRVRIELGKQWMVFDISNFKQVQEEVIDALMDKVLNRE